jgi:hypothetical protein
MSEITFLKQEIININLLIKQTKEDLFFKGDLNKDIEELKANIGLFKRDFENAKKGNYKSLVISDITIDELKEAIKQDEETLTILKERRKLLNQFLITLEKNRDNLIKEYIKLSDNHGGANVDNDFIF